MKQIYIIICLVFACIISGCDYQNDNSLKNALNNCKNYTYEIICDDGTTNLYEYFNGYIKTFVNEDCISSLIYIKEQESIIKTLDSGTTILLNNTTTEYEYLKNKYFKNVYLNEINSNFFMLNDDMYSLKSTNILEITNKLFDNTISFEFNNLSIKLNNNKIDKILCSYIENNEEHELVINFSKINLTVFDVTNNFDELKIKNVIPSVKTINVKNNTLLTEALDGVYVTVIYEDNTTQEISIEEVEYICDDYNSSKGGSFTVIINIDIFSIYINVIVESLGYYIPTDIETLDDYAYNNNLTCGMPSVGNSKALVIPVEFIDYKAKSTMKEDLEIAFFGTSDQTGWESLSSYYKKASYGKLNIEGTVLDVYNTGNTSSYYNRKYERGEDADYMIIKQALEYYDNQIDYSEYDSNNDGYIDAIYIVYTTPVDYKSSKSMWWAFTYEYYTSDYEYYDGVEADFYCFMGYDFLFETPQSGKKLTYNAETIIHETGHLLGLDDYYDYDENKGPDGGIGGGDMMDYNVGDHNPFSKILMGWVTPYVVTNTTKINLSSFGQTGGCILLIDEFSSIYDEYYLIDLYTPDGLNKLEAGNNGLFSISGIRIYHVDARLSNKDADIIFDIYEYDNSYTNHRLISLVQASGSNSIDKGKFSSNTDLLGYNIDFSINKWYYKKNIEFVINAVLKDDLTVDVSIIRK